MKTLLTIMRLPDGSQEHCGRAHTIWLALALTGMGCCVGGLSLFFSATAYVSLNSWHLLGAYLSSPLLMFLNLLPPVLLIWLFYFLFRQSWAAFICTFLPVLAIALANYFKIRLRSDPLLASDLLLAAEAGGIVGNYTLDLTWLVWFALFCFVAGLLFTIFLMPHGIQGWRERTFGALSCLALICVAFVSLYLNPTVYDQTPTQAIRYAWSDVEVYLSKGGLYPFLHSFRDMLPTPPENYDKEEADSLLQQYEDQSIPEGQKVSVMGIMLEAFCDLTDFDALAGQEGVTQVYAPWHQLEAQSISGDLLTNIFAGGTVDSEWAFLTGYSTHDEFWKDTDSYVWYLKDQGYQTFGSHPGFGWFYNRQNVNQYLGFEEYWFTENHYGELVDPVFAQWHSDPLLVQELLAQMKERVQSGPCFSFSVSYQNHGPYSTELPSGPRHLTPEGSGLSQESCNIWNNYLNGVAETLQALTTLVQGLEEMEEPVVLVLFGDHKPWGGNGNSAYIEMGATFDLSTLDGFYDYYATPYVIWANSAAKETLGRDFVGDGGDFSPCFLMTELFDQCGWTGPGFMELSRQVRAVTPLVHTQGLYLVDGQLTDILAPEDQALLDQFLSAEYFRENQLLPVE